MIAARRVRPVATRAFLCCLIVGNLVVACAGQRPDGQGRHVAPPKSGPEDELVTVAMIGGADQETRSIVEEALKSIGVPSYIEGSAVYGVQVHRRDYQRAREALRAEGRLAGRWIEYVE
jgi:hypothetical protein